MLIAIQYNFVHFSLRTFLKDVHLDVSILPMDKFLFLLILFNIMDFQEKWQLQSSFLHISSIQPFNLQLGLSSEFSNSPGCVERYYLKRTKGC